MVSCSVDVDMLRTYGSVKADVHHVIACIAAASREPRRSVSAMGRCWSASLQYRPGACSYQFAFPNDRSIMDERNVV